LVGHLEQVQHPEYLDGLIPRENAWTFNGSQLVLRVQNVFAKIRGRSIDAGPSLAEEAARSATAWNLFPFRGSILLQQRAATAALWLLWALLWGGVAAGIHSLTTQFGAKHAKPPSRGDEPGQTAAR
jgi:hypothetical protein